MNPSVVFEVLSPSTQTRDREYKFDLYTSVPECTDYVLIHYRRVRVEHFSRTGNEPWTVSVFQWRRDVLKLERYGVAVSLGDIYDGVELAEGMILVGDAGGESTYG
jgi:Uma2 family endonuclease